MSLAQQWLDSGEWVTVNGHRLFVKDSGGDKPVVCLLHGFPTSSFDYQKVWDFLSQHFRVVVHDHLGFGASDKPKDYSYSFIEQADMAIALWRQLNIKRCAVVAHDYGTSIATELMARQNMHSLPMTIERYLLSNGSVHIELAKLRPLQKLLRSRFLGPLVAQLTGYSAFKRNMRKLFVAKEYLSDEELAAHWHLLIRENGRSRLPLISQYTLERHRFWHRWINAICQSSQPIDLVWARKDPVAVPAIAEAIYQEAQLSHLHWLEECGHFPMIEQPEQWAEAVINQLSLRQHLKS